MSIVPDSRSLLHPLHECLDDVDQTLASTVPEEDVVFHTNDRPGVLAPPPLHAREWPILQRCSRKRNGYGPPGVVDIGDRDRVLVLPLQFDRYQA
jgi:hypothetical protein